MVAFGGCMFEVEEFLYTLEDGDPGFVRHSVRVAEYGTTQDEWVVAMLHDYLEDVEGASTEILEGLGVSPDQLAAIIMLTREKEGQAYAEYIENVAVYGGPLARKVKVYDLLDHLNPNTGYIGKSKRKRYLKALERIHNAIEEYDIPGSQQKP